MARVAIILAILAVVLSTQCFGACLVSDAQQSNSCPHHQKKAVERCDHSQLFSDKLTPSQENPLAAIAVLDATIPEFPITWADTIRLALSPSPPLPSTTTILKI